MGVTKNDIYTKEQNDLSAIAKALGHPARIAIIQKLIESKTCICGDLVEDIGLAQATVSQHLKELKSSGIIKGNVEGTSVCYCLDAETGSPVSTSYLISTKLNRCFLHSAKSCARYGYATTLHTRT